MNMRFTLVVLCFLGSLACTARGDGINGEATYISFSVPVGLGTYPMGINNSLEVTGYYYASPTVTRGFLREAAGTITTFDVPGATWTQPQSINAAGNITGFYQPASQDGHGVPPQGFLRYADGHIITIDVDQTDPALGAEPVSISDFDEIAGTDTGRAPTPFTRSRTGVLTTIQTPYGGVATAINASGSVVGYFGYTGFVAHPDGYWAEIALPGTPGCSHQTIPDAINAAGTIAGWSANWNCTAQSTSGFVMSPSGAITLFELPGAMPELPDHIGEYDGQTIGPHWISIDQAGDITGSYRDSEDGTQNGFVRDSYGTITTFNPPEGGSTTPTSMNDGGAIAGFYSYNTGGGPPAGFIRVPSSSFFVLDSASTVSAGSDSILTVDALGHSSVFFSAANNLQGLSDITCSWNGPPGVAVAHYDFGERVSELLQLDATGKIVSRTPLGTIAGGSIAVAFDRAGNLYAAQNAAVFKNGLLFANLPPAYTGVGKMVADGQGRLYITHPLISRVDRVDALGNVTLFADGAWPFTGISNATPQGNRIPHQDTCFR